MAPDAVITALIGIITTLLGTITFLYRRHLADDDQQDIETAQRLAALTAERDAWLRRWEAADARLDRVATAFTQAFGKAAPD